MHVLKMPRHHTNSCRNRDSEFDVCCAFPSGPRGGKISWSPVHPSPSVLLGYGCGEVVRGSHEVSIPHLLCGKGPVMSTAILSNGAPDVILVHRVQGPPLGA
jgi:hypothetical protein